MVGARAILLALAVTVLPACIDLEQDIRIANDRFVYAAVVRLDSMVAALAGSEAELCGKLMPEAGDIPKNLQVSVSQNDDGTNLSCRIAMEAPLSVLTRGQLPNGEGNTLKVERVAGDRYRLTSRIDMRDMKPGTPSMEQFGGMERLMFAGRRLRWTVSADRIVATNGQISADGKTAVWERPIAAAMNTAQTFTVEFVISTPWYRKAWNGLREMVEGIAGR